MRSATWSTARFSVTLICSPRNIASRRCGHAALVRQRGQQADRLVGDPVLRVVEVAARRPRRAGARRGRGRRRTGRAGGCHGSRRGGLERLPGGPFPEGRTVSASVTSRLLGVAAEPLAHRRQHLVGEVGLAARGEPRVERRGEHRRRHALVDRGHRPSSGPRPSRTRDRRSSARSGDSCRAWAVRSSSQEPITLPRRQTSATSGEVDVVLVVLGVLRAGVVSASTPAWLADVRVLEDVQALGVGGHDPVLDPVVDHLHEVAGAVGPAVQVALLGGARVARRGRACAARRRRPGRAWRRSGRAVPTASSVAADHQAVAAIEPQTPPLVPTST